MIFKSIYLCAVLELLSNSLFFNNSNSLNSFSSLNSINNYSNNHKKYKYSRCYEKNAFILITYLNHK